MPTANLPMKPSSLILLDQQAGDIDPLGFVLKQIGGFGETAHDRKIIRAAAKIVAKILSAPARSRRTASWL